MQIKASFSYVNLESLSQTTERQTNRSRFQLPCFLQTDKASKSPQIAAQNHENSHNRRVSYRRTRHPNQSKFQLSQLGAKPPKKLRLRELSTDAQGIQVKANSSYHNLKSSPKTTKTLRLRNFSKRRTKRPNLSRDQLPKLQISVQNRKKKIQRERKFLHSPDRFQQSPRSPRVSESSIRGKFFSSGGDPN